MNPLHTKILKLRQDLIDKGGRQDWSTAIKEKLINDFTYHSTKIEGLELSYGDTIQFLRNGIIRGHEKLKDISDLNNHQEVLRFIFQTYESLELNVETIKELHKKLMRDPIQWSFRNAYSGGPGEFKRENNFGYRGDLPQKEYMDWEHVPKELEKLCFKTRQKLQDPSTMIEAIHEFHFEFANNIHPFGDGNGRMARLIHNLLLLKHDFPVVIIKAGEKKRYLKSIIKQEEHPEVYEFDRFLSEKLYEALSKKLA